MNSFLAFQYYTSSLFFLGRVYPFHRIIWLALPLAALASILLLYLYHRYQRTHPAGAATLAVSSLLAALLFALSLFCFTQFMHTCVLKQVPAWLFGGVFALLCIFGGMKKLGVLERFSALTGWVVVVLLLLADLSGLLKMRFFSESEWISMQEYFQVPLPVFGTSFLFLFLIYLSEGFVLCTSISCNKKAPWSYFQTARGQALSTLLVSATYMITSLVLGPFVFEALTYPIYYPAGLSFTAEYLDRIEIILLAVFCLTEFVKLSVLANHIKTAWQIIGRRNSRLTESPSPLRQADTHQQPS